MDFVDWCSVVLKKLIEASLAEKDAWYTGVGIDRLSEGLFGRDTSVLSGTTEGQALVDATRELQELGLVDRKDRVGRWLEVTRLGQELAEDMSALWEQICSKKLMPEQAKLLESINELSERVSTDHSWLEYSTCADTLSRVGWSDKNRIWAVGKPLESQLRFLAEYPALDSDMGFRATYSGLAWTSRRGLTIESKRIDALIKEWETTSVDFKRELSINTADEKAEFVKDILGLANTQASGRRLLIIGIDDKTRAYHRSGCSALSQNRI